MVATAIGGGFSLIVLIAIPVINFWAVTRIIHQAGYSRNWIMVSLPRSCCSLPSRSTVL